jgi:rubrerythrin
MSELFILEDILNALITLESHGNRLYLALADRAADLDAMKLFANLAEQELQHKTIYMGFKDKLRVQADLDEDYTAYLTELLRSNIQLRQIDLGRYDHDQALELGIQLEKDTLSLLGELERILSEKRSEIDQLVEEERKHLVQLLQLQRG